MNPIQIETIPSTSAVFVGKPPAAQLKEHLHRENISVSQISNADIFPARRKAPSMGSENTSPFSASPDFLYWFPSGTHPPPPSLLRLADKTGIKIIIIFSPQFAVLDCPRAGFGIAEVDRLSEIMLKPFTDRGNDACLVIPLDLYGPKVENSRLSAFFSELNSGRILLPENDYLPSSPLYLSDFLTAISKITFSSGTRGQTLILSGANRLNILSLSFLVREAFSYLTGRLPEISNSEERFPKIDFDGLTPRCARKLIFWEPKHPLADGVRQTVVSAIYQSYLESASAARLVPPAKITADKKIPPWPNLKSGSQAGARGAEESRTVLAMGPWSFITVLVLLVSLMFFWSKSTRSYFPNVNFNFRSKKSPSAAANQLTSLSLQTSELSGAVLGTSTSDQVNLLQSIGQTASNLLQNYSSGDWRPLVSLGRELLPAARWMLGFDRKQTIALILQNSNELRPTGGFITQIGLATFEKGRLLDLNWLDVDQIDSGLSGRQDPPLPLQKYLGESNWFLRDANWDPDARVSAGYIRQIINRSTGRQVDGMVFITTPALQLILASAGPITVKENGQITSQNLSYRASFSPAVLAETMMVLRRQAAAPPDSAKVILGILKALKSHDLTVVSFDPEIAQILSLQAVDGAIYEAACPPISDQKCLSDSLFIVDANLGVNQSDLNIRRDRVIQVEIYPPSSSLPAAKPEAATNIAATLRYQNAGDSNFSFGIYRSYTRVILPPDSTVKSLVEIDASGKTRPISPDEYSGAGYRAIGWYFQIPPQADKTFRLELARPQPPPAAGGQNYYLVLQKQAGAAAPAIVSIKLPANMAPISASPPATIAPHSLIYRLNGENSANLTAEFSAE